MNHFNSIREYCLGLNIPHSRWEECDVRRFEDLMHLVPARVDPFRHSFYCVGLKLDGDGHAKMGLQTTKNLSKTVFVNSPLQEVSWDITPNWVGYYVSFTDNFLKLVDSNLEIAESFSFMRSDALVPLDLSVSEGEQYLELFRMMEEEIQENKPGAQRIMAHLIYTLLLRMRRFYNLSVSDHDGIAPDHGDVSLTRAFRALVSQSVNSGISSSVNPHQVQFYANALKVTSSHLNAVVTRCTGRKASELIQDHIITVSQTKLRQTQMTVKQIAFELGFSYPSHFSTYFKRQVGLSPAAYRKSPLRKI